jgi:hypothetical protein
MESDILKKIKNKRYNWIKYIIGICLMFWGMFFIYGIFKPMPKGLSIEGSKRYDTNLSLIYDITYQNNGKKVVEQQIFEKIFKMIDEAEKFIVIDMFLFNSDYDKKVEYPKVSEKLVHKLVEKKKSNKNIKIIFITDEINGMYGAYETSEIKILKENGIDVVITDLNKLRDSNMFYSSFWRSFIKWFGVGKNGKISNPFSKESEKVTIRAYLKLLNFKANHRKVVVTEKEGMISSANPHNPSGYHSNIAFCVKGDILKDILEGERAIAEISGYKEFDIDLSVIEKSGITGKSSAQVITEGKIGKKITEIIKKAEKEDKIYIGVFYLSDRKVIKEIKKAVERGADIDLILDYNRDAFGRKKNGIPNRTVAEELYKKTNGKIKIYWYKSSGEQYHTKLLYMQKGEKVIITGGSANFTRKNLRDFNLEENLHIESNVGEKIAQDTKNYFERVLNPIYTEPYEYKKEGIVKKWIYRFQEWSGMATF